MGQLGQTTRKVDKLRYLYETYIWCILQDIVQRTIFLHSLRTMSISKYTIMLKGINWSINNVCWLFLTFLLQENIFWGDIRICFLFLLKVLDGNQDRNSEVKHAVYSLNKISLIFASNSPGWGVYENRIVSSNTKAKWVWNIVIVHFICNFALDYIQYLKST